MIQEQQLLDVLGRLSPTFKGKITSDTPLTDEGLGLDSLAFADLIGALEQTFSVRIREEDVRVDTFGTVGRLLIFLRSRADSESHRVGDVPETTLLKALQLGCGRAPFVMVNGDVFGDGALYCLELAQRLGPEQPFYSLSSHGTNGGPIPPTIQLMATDHVMTLRASVPGAPYLLGGFSHGGLVAFEMARQLTAFGCRVPLVVIIDMPPSQPVRQPAPKLRVPSRGPRLHAALKTLGRAARHHVTRLTQTSMERLGAAGGAVAEPDDSPARADVRHTPAWRRRQWVTYGRIVREYNPGWYPGSVTVMIARDGHYAEAMSDDALGWRTVAGRVRTIFIPGDHVTAVTKHTATIARHLDRCLAEICG